MNILYTLIIITLLLFIFYEQTRVEGFKVEDKYSHLSEKEKKNIILKNDVNLYLIYKKAKLSSLINNNKKNITELSKPYLKYKIAFITFENREEEYINLHDINVKKYCDKWKYDYHRIKENNSNLSPYWYKVLLVSEIIESDKYDYVFWMDSDTIINNFNIDLGEDILHKYNSDIFVASDNIKYDIVNAGLFVVKNSETGKQFIKDWLNLYLPMCEKGNGKLKGVWAMTCYEQGTLNKLIVDKYNKNTTLLNNNLFKNSVHCDNKDFITHLYANNSHNREKCFSKKKMKKTYLVLKSKWKLNNINKYHGKI